MNNYDLLVVRDHYPSQNNPSNSPWVYDQVKYMTDKGVSTMVISPAARNPFGFYKSSVQKYEEASVGTSLYLGTNVIRPPYVKFPFSKFIGLTLFNLSNSIRNHGAVYKPKLIHAHFGQNGVASLKLKKHLRIPLVTSFYGFDAFPRTIYRPFYEELISKGDIFLVLSENMKTDLLEMGFPENKIIIHHLGIDTKQFKPSQRSKNNNINLLVVARFEERKGIEYVIHAIKKIIEIDSPKYSNLRLRLIGSGPIEDKLKKLVKDLGLDREISFYNNLPFLNSREIVLKEMQECDIFLLTSFTTALGDKEGTPVVLLEAQACGKPCIATNHAGIPETVKDNYSGFIVEEKSVDEIVKYLRVLIDDANLRISMGENARSFIEQKFNNDKQMVLLEKIYNNLGLI